MINIREYVREELKKYDGIYLPVRVSFLEQVFLKKLPPQKLHPNPDDEFCSKEVGPSDEIISKYTKQIHFNQIHNIEIFEEPLIIEKIRPDGYMLLNGHHRWAAALMMDVKKVHVKLTNVVRLSDIVGQMEKTNRTKRASINLDDVVFCQNETEPAEKPLIFPFNKIFRERIRLGIPGLVYALQSAGYDVWFYTTGYASAEYIKHLLRHHRITINGMINGANRLNSARDKNMSSVKDLMDKKYRITLNIDMDTVSWIRSETKEFDQIEIPSDGDNWSQNVIEIVRKLKGL